MNSIQDFWDILLEQFEKTNSEFTFNHWIKPAEPVRIEKNILYIKSLLKHLPDIGKIIY